MVESAIGTLAPSQNHLYKVSTVLISILAPVAVLITAALIFAVLGSTFKDCVNARIKERAKRKEITIYLTKITDAKKEIGKEATFYSKDNDALMARLIGCEDVKQVKLEYIVGQAGCGKTSGILREAFFSGAVIYKINSQVAQQLSSESSAARITERLTEAYNKILQEALKNPNKRYVLFIDELDKMTTENSEMLIGFKKFIGYMCGKDRQCASRIKIIGTANIKFKTMDWHHQKKLKAARDSTVQVSDSDTFFVLREGGCAYYECNDLETSPDWLNRRITQNTFATIDAAVLQKMIVDSIVTGGNASNIAFTQKADFQNLYRAYETSYNKLCKSSSEKNIQKTNTAYDEYHKAVSNFVDSGECAQELGGVISIVMMRLYNDTAQTGVNINLNDKQNYDKLNKFFEVENLNKLKQGLEGKIAELEASIQACNSSKNISETANPTTKRKIIFNFGKTMHVVKADAELKFECEELQLKSLQELFNTIEKWINAEELNLTSNSVTLFMDRFQYLQHLDIDSLKSYFDLVGAFAIKIVGSKTSGDVQKTIASLVAIYSTEIAPNTALNASHANFGQQTSLK